MLRLWIKGCEQEAQTAAKERNIEIRVSKVTPSGLVLADCEHAHYTEVVRWFQEDPPCVEGKGFPAGTLMLYA